MPEDTITPIDHLPVALTHSTRAKRLALRLDTKARIIRLVVPKGVSERKAHKFALKHEDWIIDKIDELPPLIPFENGRIIPILGQNYRILVRRDSRATEITRQDNTLLVRTNKAADISKRVTSYLKKLAKEELAILAHEKAERIMKPIRDVTVRDTKSRWGSCGSDGKICFSWRLIMAPEAAMDYVVAHEVAHLIHMNHGKRFWTLCEKLSDDYDEGLYWMKAHGQELQRYG